MSISGDFTDTSMDERFSGGRYVIKNRGGRKNHQEALPSMYPENEDVTVSVVNVSGCILDDGQISVLS